MRTRNRALEPVSVGEGLLATAGQAGFSMIEMLMTAFILAVGLLGLCMLQTLSLRASRGSSSLTTAVHVADAVMDQVELEGRLSWLNTTTSLGPAANLSLVYIPLPVLGSLRQTFNLHGDVSDGSSPDPTVSSQLFKVTTTRVDDLGPAGAGTGQVSDYSVLVRFADTVNSAQAPVNRQVLLTRRILHG